MSVTLTLLNSNGGWTFFNLWLKVACWACLVVYGLKFIFHWVAHLLVLSKSLLFKIIWRGLNVMYDRNQRDIIWKSFALDERPAVRLLMSIKNKGPGLGHWRTPALIFFPVENYPFKKSCKRFSKFPDLSFWVSLRMISSCHTLLNAFKISRNTLLTSRHQKNYISQV